MLRDIFGIGEFWVGEVVVPEFQVERGLRTMLAFLPQIIEKLFDLRPGVVGLCATRGF
jgi:hypothetical protein